jgi:[acyl-carrier-protein] S-malonyltransferase
MIAWLVAGQGAEHAGMGLELAQSYAPAAELWTRASDAAAKDLRRLSDRGGPSLLRTEYLQPALTAVALGAASFLRDEGVEPAMVLGHSAGEVAALAVAGHLTPRDACELSAIRGHVMSLAAKARPGGMAAVRTSEVELREVLVQGAKVGAIFEAGQTTAETHLVTGDRAAVRSAAAFEGVSPLPVSGPWHSPLMESASEALRPSAESAIGGAGGGPRWVSNEIARPGPGAAEATAELLLAQLTRPMKFHQSIEFLLETGVTDMVVLGPHRALRYILLSHLEDHSNVRVHGSSSLEELRTTVRALA